MFKYLKKSIYFLLSLFFIFGCSSNTIIDNPRYKEIKKEIIECSDEKFLNKSDYIDITLRKRNIPSLERTELEIIFSNSEDILRDIEIMIIDSKEKIKTSKTLFPTIGIIGEKLTLIPVSQQNIGANEYKGLTIYFDITKILDISEVLIYFAFDLNNSRLIEFIKVAI